MNNKSMLAIIAAQSAVMLGLLYILWEEESNELFINENIVLFLAAFSVAAMVLGLSFRQNGPPLMNQVFGVMEQ